MFEENFYASEKQLYDELSVDSFDKTSGLDYPELEKKVIGISKQTNKSRPVIKAEILSFILENAQVEIPKHGIFPTKLNDCGITWKIRSEWIAEASETGELQEVLKKHSHAQSRNLYRGECDFGHVCPDIERAIKLGFPGMLAEIRENAKECGSDFYTSCEIVLASVINYINRLADFAEKQTGDKDLLERCAFMAKNLRAISRCAPKTLPEAMQFLFILFCVQQNLEGENVRSIGRIDRYLAPFYINDIKSGRYTEADERSFIRYFFYRIAAVKFCANVPFMLCGKDRDGREIINDFTYAVLDEYSKNDLDDPKIHIRYSKELDARVFDMVIRMIRNGKNSFVFMNDDVVEKSLRLIGETPEDARDYMAVGCYEPASCHEDIPCTTAGRISLVKALEVTLFDGKDEVTGETICKPICSKFDSFEKLMEVYRERLSDCVDGTIDIINAFEREYPKLNPSPFFSSQLKICVENGKDIYSGGARYNNTSICVFAFADAIDALCAIKKLVFDEKYITLDELKKALAANFEGYEELRAKLMNDCPKYGTDNSFADALAADISEFMQKNINNRENGRGGVYRYAAYSIDWRFEFGETTGASAGGRLCGEPLSKNLSSTLGMDKRGVTALIKSASKIDHSKIPCGSILDIVVHSSAARGEDGLMCLSALIRTYLDLGGMGIQCNVLDPETLKKAQKEPEKYKTLQIRLCGWNVYFVDLSKQEQDEFILQSERASL